jgi:hypothetical protein
MPIYFPVDFQLKQSDLPQSWTTLRDCCTWRGPSRRGLVDDCKRDAIFSQYENGAQIDGVLCMLLTIYGMDNRHDRLPTDYMAGPTIEYTYNFCSDLCQQSLSGEQGLGIVWAGARGYLPKSAGRGEIVCAVQTVAEGGGVFGASIPRRVMENFSGQQSSEPFTS